MQQKMHKNAFFFRNIWWVEKKAVPLQPLSGRCIAHAILISRVKHTTWCGSSVG